MSLFKNRKRSGMVLTGVVLSSGVVSAVNQSVVGANNTLGILDSPGVSGVLGNVAGKGTKASGSTVATFFKKHWGWFSVALGLIVVAGVIIYYKMVSNEESDNSAATKENNVGSSKIKEEKERIKKEEAYSVNGEFKNFFCSDKEISGEFKEKFFEKTSDFEGCVLNMNVDEFVESCNKNEELKEFLEKHEGVERVNVLISKVREGFFTLGLLDEQGKTLAENINTKYVVENEDALNSFCNNFDSNKRGVYFKEMPFGKVFRCCDRKEESYRENVKGWKEIEKFEGYVYKVSIKEIRAIYNQFCAADEFEGILQDYGVDKEEIKISINGVNDDGCLALCVLDEENKCLGTLYTKYATANIEELNNLASYLSENRVSGETPFSEVLRYSSYSSYDGAWDNEDEENFGAWRRFKGLEKKKIDIKIKELRLISRVDSLEEQELLNDLEGEEIKVEIDSVMSGYLVLNVFSKGNEELLFTVNTRYAVKNNKAIKKLFKYLEDKTEKKVRPTNLSGFLALTLKHVGLGLLI